MIEQNRMSITTSVIEPPINVVKTQPIKDAYLSQRDAVFSFGDSTELMVMHSNSGKEYKALMVFKTPELAADDFYNLRKAVINFSVTKYLQRNVNLAFKYHIDDGWPEYGTTWACQPIETDETFKRVAVPAKSNKFSIDVTDIIKAAGPGGRQLAFTIFEESEENQTSPIFIGARESKTGTAPSLDISYIYYPGNYDATDLASTFSVRRNNNADIASELTIKNGVTGCILPADLTVKKYEAFADLSTDIVPNPVVFNTQIFSDNMTVVRHVPNSSEKAPEIEAGININKYQKDIDFPVNDLRVNSFKNNADFACDIYVPHTAVIDAEMEIRKFRGTSDINVDFAIKKDISLDEAPFFPASLIIKKYDASQDINTSLTVRRSVENIKVSEEHNVPWDIPQVESSLEIIRKHNGQELQSELNVKPNGFADINTDLTVKGTNTAIDGIDSSVKVRGHLNICADDFVIRKLAEKDLNCELISRPSYGADILTTLITVRDSKKPYAFLM